MSNRKKTPEEKLETKILIRQRYKEKLRKETMFRYGEVCQVCHTTENLQIDHINGGGRQERKILNKAAGYHFYQYLRKMGYPEGYRVLCVGCNAMAHYLTDSEITQHYLDAAERIKHASRTNTRTANG